MIEVIGIDALPIWGIADASDEEVGNHAIDQDGSTDEVKNGAMRWR